MSYLNQLLAGRPFTRETHLELLRDPKARESDARTLDTSFLNAVREMGKRLDEMASPTVRKIPFEQSRTLQMREGNELSVEFLRKCMKDSRYSGDPWERDPEYIRCVESGFKELFAGEGVSGPGMTRPGIAEKPIPLSGNREVEPERFA